MCILITTTAHPDYPLILLSNRDEFLARPTELTRWRMSSKNTKVLSPVDLGRPERGTWIGVTSSGKLAVLVNYREDQAYVSKVSRGLLPLIYLTSGLTDEEWYEKLPGSLAAISQNGEQVSLDGISGFTLVYGTLGLDDTGKLKPLNIISNRGDRGRIHSTGPDRESQLHEDIARQSTFCVSNTLYYKSWYKTKLGAKKLDALVQTALEARYIREELVEACFLLLSHDTYDPAIRDLKSGFQGQKMHELRNSIFIPPVQVCSGDGTAQEFQKGPNVGRYYGTRTQTVILLDRSGRVHYHERDLYTEDSPKLSVRDQYYYFDLDLSGTQAPAV